MDFTNFFAAVCAELATNLIQIARKEYKEKKEKDQETVKELKGSIGKIYNGYETDIVGAMDEQDGLHIEEVTEFFLSSNKDLGSLIESLNQGKESVKHIFPKEVKNYVKMTENLKEIYDFVENWDTSGDKNETAEKALELMDKYEDNLEKLDSVFG